ncbi:MAG: transposase [Myxococcaceae bacterium]|nr:transposase [Myxococcaceae bacterium]
MSPHCSWNAPTSNIARSKRQLTPHLHALLPEALWTKDGEVVTLPAPDDAEVASILLRVLRAARKDFADVEAPWPEDEYEASQRESLQAPLGLALPPTPRRRRVAVGMGFSLHADTAVHGHDRQGLERLCRYGSRGPVAESRLRRLEDGRYEYAPKGKDASGRLRSAFVLTAAAFVRRLVALVPPPNTHLTNFHGVFAPHAALRPTVTLRPTPMTPAPTRKTKRRKPTRRLDWASLHQHTFGTDVLRCPCGGRRRLHAIHSTRKTAKGAPPPARPSPRTSSRPPARHCPARPPAGGLMDTLSTHWPSRAVHPSARWPHFTLDDATSPLAATPPRTTSVPDASRPPPRFRALFFFSSALCSSSLRPRVAGPASFA